MDFISGVTMSPEEAVRQAEARNAAFEAEAAADERERVVSWGSGSRRRSSTVNIPPSPSYQPPPPPPSLPPPPPPPGRVPSEANTTLQRAEQEAWKSEKYGAPEQDIPDRILRTTAAPASPGAPIIAKHGAPGSSQSVERKDSAAAQTAILPVVEEAAEGGSIGDPSRSSRVDSIRTESEERPLTPAKDGEEMRPGFGNLPLGVQGRFSKDRGPPTPPKTAGQGAYLKPESADSGYGVTGAGAAGGHGLKSASGSQKSLSLRPQISRDSLDKALPPLPTGEASSRSPVS